MVTPRKSPEFKNFDETDDDSQEFPDEDELAAQDEKPKPTAAELDKWFSRPKVAALLGKSVQSVARLVQRGDLHPITHKGQQRFDPKEVDELIGMGDADATQETLRNLNVAFETSQQQATKLISMITTPATTLHELLARENKRLTDRVSELEDKMIETFESYEQALTLKAERESAQQAEIERQKRLNTMMQTGMSLLPVLLKQLQGSRVVDQVFARISVENLETLKEAQVLSEAEYQALVEIKNGQAKPAESQSVEQTVATQ